MYLTKVYEKILNKNLKESLKCRIELNGIIYLLSILGTNFNTNYNFTFSVDGIISVQLIKDMTKELLKKTNYNPNKIIFSDFIEDKIEIVKQMLIYNTKCSNMTAWIQTLASVHYLKTVLNISDDDIIIKVLFRTNIMFQNENMIKNALKFFN